MKQNYRFIISYDGTRYSGWQRLPGKDTIQGKIEMVLAKMVKADIIEMNGAGRTDAGVHAKAMVANCVLDTDLSVEEIKDYMNTYLPDDIGIDEVQIAGPRFHARYHATGKTYQYTCYIGAAKPVFLRKYVTMLTAKPDIERMRTAAEYLIGTHDFKNFCGNPKMKKSTKRTIDCLEIVESGDYLKFIIHGDGFLQNMVRIIVGTLLEIGYGKMDSDTIIKSLNSEERMKAGPTAPPQGLCMMQVDYD